MEQQKEVQTNVQLRFFVKPRKKTKNEKELKMAYVKNYNIGQIHMFTTPSVS